MKKSKILIVEDEILIADRIKKYLTSKDFETVGIAMSYEEAVDMLKEHQPDLALLDIRLNSSKTGIDVAHHINKEHKIPFIYLTSQLDSTALQSAKSTFPSGYLSKPMQKETLYSTIEIALFNHIQESESTESEFIILASGYEKNKVNIDSIKYIQSDHIYLKVFTDSSEQHLMVRKALKELKDMLPGQNFIQPNRSTIVNINHIDKWDSSSIFIGETKLSISRNNKESILEKLKKM